MCRPLTSALSLRTPRLHIFQPLLYQVATAVLSPSEVAAPIRQLARKQKKCAGTAARTALGHSTKSLPR
jgi:NADH dehydrogenase FAD-containing subunit